MGFKETNYGKFTDTENQDYKIVKERETLPVINTNSDIYLKIEYILIKAQ